MEASLKSPGQENVGAEHLDHAQFNLSFFQLVDAWGKDAGRADGDARAFRSHLAFFFDRIAVRCGDEVHLRWVADPDHWVAGLPARTPAEAERVAAPLMRALHEGGFREDEDELVAEEAHEFNVAERERVLLEFEEAHKDHSPNPSAVLLRKLVDLCDWARDDLLERVVQPIPVEIHLAIGAEISARICDLDVRAGVRSQTWLFSGFVRLRFYQNVRGNEPQP